MGDKIAKFVKDVSSKFKGMAKVYEMNPPITWPSYSFGDDKPHTSKYVVVSAIKAAFDTGMSETYIFPSDARGKIKDWGELDGSQRGIYDIKAALQGAGYTIDNS